MRIAMIALLAAGTVAAPRGTVIKLGTLAPEGSPWYDQLRDMAEQWGRATGGQVEFRIYPGGVAGDEPDMIRKMRIGQLHAAALTGVGLSSIAPEVMAIQTPMVLQTYEELDYVMSRMAPKFEKLLQERGYTVLHWGDAGWVTFFATGPVATVEDLGKHKLFVWNAGGSDLAIWKELGVQPVPLPVPEIHAGLKSGLISAMSTTPLAALSFQWFGQANHMSDLPWAPLVGATVISNRQWNKIPADQRPALMAAARATGEKLKGDARKLGDTAVAEMKKRGLVVVPVPAEAKARWEQVARERRAQFLEGAKVPAELVDEIIRHRDEFRAKQPK